MKPSYDKDNDSLYVHFCDRPGADAREIADGEVIDVDDAGQIVGLDIEHASQKLDLSRLVTEGFPGLLGTWCWAAAPARLQPPPPGRA